MDIQSRTDPLGYMAAGSTVNALRPVSALPLLLHPLDVTPGRVRQLAGLIDLAAAFRKPILSTISIYTAWYVAFTVAVHPSLVF